MPHYPAVIPSTRSVDEAFSYMSDFSNARSWDPSITVARRLDNAELSWWFALRGATRRPHRPHVSIDSRTLEIHADVDGRSIADVPTTSPGRAC
jgi:hypothetical protein